MDNGRQTTDGRQPKAVDPDRLAYFIHKSVKEALREFDHAGRLGRDSTADIRSVRERMADRN